MRIVELRADGPDKLLHVDAEGCVVHISVGLHDVSGELYTSVEVAPAQPADDGAIWVAEGPTAMLVRRRGPQVLRGDARVVHGGDAPSGPQPGLQASAGAAAP